MRDLRILYIDLAVRYLNPTRSYPASDMQAGRLDVFGPGYVSSETLDAGLDRFVADNGPYDAIVVNEHMIFPWADGKAPVPSQVRRTSA